jgi:hypothetical protein
MNIINKIEKDNAAFEVMTNSQKRVAIAKDALQWIRLGALTPTKGTYLRPQLHPTLALDYPERAAVQANTLNWGACQCCAKGALFVAKVNRFDNCSAMDFQGFTGQNLLMDGIFLRDEFDMIESAFEGWMDDQWRWFKKYPNAKTRMMAILRNIIRNQGDFKPRELVAPKKRKM